MSGRRVQVLGPTEGRSLAPVGIEVVLKSTAEDTDGHWTLYEYTAPPRFPGPPPHWHKETEEAFFILEGTVRFEVGGQTIDSEVGGYVHVTPGVVHSFSNPTDASARFLGLIVPGGFEKYWEELGELMANESNWPPADMGPVHALAARYDTFPPPAP